MKHSLIVLIFLVVVVSNIAIVQGATYVVPHSPQNGPSDTLGADQIVSFFDLPLWVQAAWVISVLLGIFGLLTFWPVIVGKVKTILRNKNREAIFEYIRDHPGCTIANLSKNTGINRGSVKYHLSVLLLEGKIVRKKEDKLTYLFPNSGTAPDKKRMYGYIMSHPKQEILKVIQDEPGISNKEIAQRLGLDPSTVYWHLKQFLEEKMIVSQWDGGSMNYTLTMEVDDILKKYRIQ
ncbi:MAG: winged helix-turn-helix transcriptional regulator [Methanoregula sp.]|jgi:predicted transcriptional regulator